MKNKDSQKKGIHGGNSWDRGEQSVGQPNVKAQAKVAARQQSYDKDIAAHPGWVRGTTRPGSLNVRNR